MKFSEEELGGECATGSSGSKCWRNETVMMLQSKNSLKQKFKEDRLSE